MAPNLATVETLYYPVYGRDPNLPPHQLLQPMQQFLGHPETGVLILEFHGLALAITKKTPDENHCRTP